MKYALLIICLTLSSCITLTDADIHRIVEIVNEARKTPPSK